MNAAIVVPTIQALGVAAFVFAGQWVVARLSRKGQDAATRVDSQARATAAWESYAERMEARLGVLEERLSATEAREESLRRKIIVLENQAARDIDLIRVLAARLRRAQAEVRRLGGNLTDADLEAADLAETRIHIAEERP